ncbi:Na+/H+-dicarboxylate symporter [Roseivirga pacifica]|uniref:Na+/H+-dicarboxylate symporter n=2 Tax=Roseivirga pacifica TaxID=1267423 RepID=A0A1I0NL97_9BACT|nr:dicarboxylate/amino acid:cation symporter [Roseivirga pacifica]MCO6359809.1 cation:dicarboxylase symporter family transporter [Roseivirga pacifica]MCO6367179.1 cation:dicarboxylase symporter family transporter [Roseivirga pacifica]MCO6370289.1 cation:dicarboxylase symporter family transporter [Roseivirga pacifica]MCO6374836.1 cation:dicarboxylase symporter family transporter [Roseivirga pacifica]MCO6380094.1 cation:dicarboxylase symporter family transporter [Roseivirga pacifica]
MKKLPLHVKIMLGLVAGVIWAFLSSSLGWNQFTITWIDPFGQIFIRMLKYIAVPLVLFSIISGISGLKDMSKLGRMGGKTLSFYLVTTVIAVGVGLALVNLVKPGALIDEEQRIKNRLQYESWVAATNGVEILDGKNYMADPQYSHLYEAEEMTEAEKKMVAEKQAAASQNKDAGPLKFIVDMVPQNIMLSLSNDKLMLQVIFFAIFFGICMASLPQEKVAGLSNFVNGANEVFLKMVDFVMKAAPFFVFCLLAGVIAKMADTPGEVFEIFKGLASYSVTLVAGLLFLIFVFYPLVVRAFVKSMTYRKFFQKISPAQFLAFSTSSSAATLPVTMECVEDNLGVSKNVSSFVLPIGATVNMDGTSLYQAVAVVFMAQLHMVDLSFTQQATIVLTATLASIGSAAVPSAGLVMMVVVLQSVGLNPAWIAIIFPVDRPLDMLRTVVNVTGDATVSTLVAKSEGELKED